MALICNDFRLLLSNFISKLKYVINGTTKTPRHNFPHNIFAQFYNGTSEIVSHNELMLHDLRVRKLMVALRKAKFVAHDGIEACECLTTLVFDLIIEVNQKEAEINEKNEQLGDLQNQIAKLNQKLNLLKENADANQTPLDETIGLDLPQILSAREEGQHFVELKNPGGEDHQDSGLKIPGCEVQQGDKDVATMLQELLQDKRETYRDFKNVPAKDVLQILELSKKLCRSKFKNYRYAIDKDSACDPWY
jgi:DNA-binding ferritin-like protein (Dps family)